MAKVIIAGNAVVIRSTLPLADIKTVARFRPDALNLKGGEDGKQTIFAIAPTTGEGGISKFGASFNAESRCDGKFAEVTMCVAGAGDDAAGWIADNLGGALVNLNALEASLPAVVEAIAAQRTEIINNITVA